MSLDDLPVVGDYQGAPPKPERGSDRKRRRQTRTRAGKAFREAVRQRDGYHCRHCGRPVRKTTDLLADYAAHVHHLIPRNVAPERKYDIDNAILLCGKCHLVAHKQRTA